MPTPVRVAMALQVAALIMLRDLVCPINYRIRWPIAINLNGDKIAYVQIFGYLEGVGFQTAGQHPTGPNQLCSNPFSFGYWRTMCVTT